MGTGLLLKFGIIRLPRFYTRRASNTHVEYAVRHGRIANATDLRGHGKLYFLPVGRHSIPVRELADYYRKKFNIEITLLAEAPLRSTTCIPQRKQCDAEEMIQDMRRAYPQIADDPESVMIALTDEDLFAHSFPKFTYSYRDSYRFGVVSTVRMNPAFWGEPANESIRLARTRQMLTKYVALLYFRLPTSYDPTSVLYQPLDPDGGPDDLYESDLHSEESANGLRGRGWPCLAVQYSYTTGKLKVADPGGFDCAELEDTSPQNDEIFEVMFGLGRFSDKSLDLRVDASPSIELRRAYLSDYLRPQGFGLGASHNYNTHLISDGPNKLTYIEVVREDASRLHLDRVTPGIGFSHSAEYVDSVDASDVYGAKIVWDTDHFKLQYPDGSWSTYLPCDDQTCYWIGYQDAKGRLLRFDRDNSRTLHSLTSGDNQKVEFELDTQGRVIALHASDGRKVSYAYDDAGRLMQVTRPDGWITIYKYDSQHHMTQVIIAGKAGVRPRTLITNEYDSAGRISKLILPGIGVYKIDYVSRAGNHLGEFRMTDPAGKLWDFSLTDEDYTVRIFPVRFPAVDGRTGAQR